MLDIKDIYYIAGLLEGEGWFGFTGKTARIHLAMTDKDTIEKYASLFDIRVNTRQRGEWQTQYIAYMHGSKAIGLMLTIYSLMSNRRRAKIREVVAEWKKIRLTVSRKVGDYCKIGHLLTKDNIRFGSHMTLECRTCQ